MDKLAGTTKDIISDNISKLKQLFPQAFSENKIDFDALKQLLGDYIDDNNERYSFKWHGKNKSKKLATTQSTGTLRPCKDESVNWDNSNNLFIEGDNLEVLKLLQKSYHKKVKMIYIDPPYNTGKDFVYKDNFKDNIKNYKEMTGQTDGDGRNLSSNPETSGRYHTDWLNMMYPRLLLARSLLSDDGVIFISIDDNEVANLRKICDEILGEENFVGDVIRKTKSTTNDAKNGFNIQHETCLIYGKNKANTNLCGDEKDFSKYTNPDNDPSGAWINDNPSARTGNTNFPIKNPFTGTVDFPPKGRCWGFSKASYELYVKTGKIKFKKNHKPKERGFIFKRYLSEVKSNYYQVDSLFASSTEYMNQVATKEGNLLFEENIMSYPKPMIFIKKLVQYSITSNQDIILDFFSGSATTAHAVMQLNAEDNGNRKYIMVQLPEACDEESEAYKAGYKNIAEIGKERIRRAANKIQTENPDYQGDLGFKVFKLDSTNIKPWDVDFNINEQDLFDRIDNIKPERSTEDILYEILLKYGLDLTLPIEEHNILGTKLFNIGSGALIICLEKNISLELVEEIVKLKAEYQPETMRVVFQDSCFADCVIKTNAVQILQQAGITDVKSL